MEEVTAPLGKLQTDCVYTRGLSTNLSLAATFPTSCCGSWNKMSLSCKFGTK